MIIILTGPTASGKTDLGLELAARHPKIEIINADSMLVYRGMDIGTAKPSSLERQKTPHHLIDIRDPDEPFTAGDFVHATEAAIADIENRGKKPLIVGGTGFYLKALLFGLWEGAKTNPQFRAELETQSNQELYRKLLKADPPSAERIGPSDRYRLIRSLELIKLSGKTPTQLQALLPKTPDPRFALWVVDRAGVEIQARIEARARKMLAEGFIEEVRQLRKKFPHSRALAAVGYAQVCESLDGIKPAGRKIAEGEEGLYSEIVLATRKLVKRQRTWFRGQKEARNYHLPEDRERLISEFEATLVEKPK